MNFYINTPTAELTIRSDKNSPEKFSLHGVETVHFAQTRRFGKRCSVTDLVITDEDGNPVTSGEAAVVDELDGLETNH